MNKKLNYIILIMLVFIVVTAPMTSAMATKKAIIVVEEDEWDITEDSARYDCFSTASGGLAMTFEGTGWWIFRSSITFILVEDGLHYETGWWLWKETGTVTEVASVNNSNNTLYEDYKLWHVTVDESHVQFFYIKYNSSLNTSLLGENTTILFFGQSMEDSVAGVMYESDTPILTSRQPTLTDLWKFQEYME